MHSFRHFTLGPDHLWTLAVLVALGCLVALIPIDQVDFWWHMAIGRDIIQSGSIPVASSHSWALAPNTPFVYGSWLSEAALYCLNLLGGLPLIVLVRNVLLLAAYGLVGIEARRRSGSWRLAALAIGGAGLMALNNVSVRPQMFAWVSFTLVVLLVGSFRAGQLRARWLLCLPALLLLWTNLHGTFALGLGFLGLVAFGETLAWLLRQPRQLSARQVTWLWLALVGSALATVGNPRGLNIVGFVNDLVSHQTAQQFVGEWQPPHLLSFPGILIPLTLLVAALGVVRSPRHFSITDALVLLAFGWLAVSAVRNVIWFGMIAWPIAVGLLAQRQPRRAARCVQLPVLNLGLAAGLCVPLMLVQPPFKGQLALGSPFSGMADTVPDGTFIGPGTPVSAVAWLQQQALPGDARVFHDMVYGSYLIWALPQARVFVDGRIELYPVSLWQRYQRISEGADALQGLAELGATHALLSHGRQSELIDQLGAANSGWRQVYDDPIAVIYERVPADGGTK